MQSCRWVFKSGWASSNVVYQKNPKKQDGKTFHCYLSSLKSHEQNSDSRKTPQKARYVGNNVRFSAKCF